MSSKRVLLNRIAFEVATVIFLIIAVLGDLRAHHPLTGVLATSLTVQTKPGARTDEIQFSRDVLPILSNKCFRCHGPDENTREAGLRLDVEEQALDYGAIVGGDIESSEMIVRIISDDEGDRMPPTDSDVPAVTEAEADILKKWIRQGAKWQTHWAFVPSERPELPEPEEREWGNNPIDSFVLARLTEQGLQPSGAARKSTLLRRVSLLVTGLPPDRVVAKKFLENDSPDAYEKLVDQLFRSEAYGERMAAGWMDVARYSDTDGFQQDEPRNNWPWRDWVIDAYNHNMPFDQFTIEQFAGDLLPNATKEQILATCFHRNHMTNSEGGRDPEESRVDYVLDRVNTTGTAWLGLTLGCAQCHSHKYDPITQKEYYQLSAFFNNVDEDGRAGDAAKPYLDWQLKNPEIHLQQPRRQVAEREKELARKVASAKAKFPEWLEQQFDQKDLWSKSVADADWRTFEIEETATTDESVVFEAEADGIWRIAKGKPNNDTYTLTGPVDHERIGSIRIEALPHNSFKNGGLSRADSGNFVLTDVVAHILRPKSSEDSDVKENDGKTTEDDRIPLDFKSAWADYSQPGYPVELAIDSILDTGWAVWSGDMKQRRTGVFRLEKSSLLQTGDRLEIQLVHFSHNPRHNIGRFRISISPIPDASHATTVADVLSAVDESKSLSDSQKEELLSYYVEHDGHVGLTRALQQQDQQELEEARKSNSVGVMVLRERKNELRNTYILSRGVWDAHDEQVVSSTPVAIGPEVPSDGARNRLDLARWLVDRKNPLTARVTVNRYWQMYFGAGLVRTPEDFGVQGEFPTHPQLLDWLAVEFMESGWDIKKIHKLIVMSATFQQSSVNNAQLLELDPDNRLLSRGPRFRMPASMIRDNALAISGLLTRRVGGPSVKPYQPENVWSASDQGKYPYTLATGDDLYRRSLYTYWRRNISPPGMFDAAQRRVCEVKTRRTNSPMHALAMLNDTTYVEAARVLAQIVLKQSNQSDRAVINGLFRRALLRDATTQEQERLSKSLNDLQDEYQASPELALQLLSPGRAPLDNKLDRSKLAAITIIASTVLNLDETLNIE